jgi:hypothetical protein
MIPPNEIGDSVSRQLPVMTDGMMTRKDTHRAITLKHIDCRLASQRIRMFRSAKVRDLGDTLERKHPVARPSQGPQSCENAYQLQRRRWGCYIYLPTAFWLHSPTHAGGNNQGKDKDGEIAAPFILGRFWSRNAIVDVNARWPPDTQSDSDDRVHQDLQSRMRTFHFSRKCPQPDADEEDRNVVSHNDDVSFRQPQWAPASFEFWLWFLV